MTVDVFKGEFEQLRSDISALRNETAELEKYRGFWAVEWPLFKKIAVVGACILGAGTLTTFIYARRQTTRKAEEIELKALSYVFDEMFQAGSSKARRFIYAELPADPKNASRSDWEIVHQVIHSFEKIAYLIDSGLLSQEHGINVCYVPAIKVWQKLVPYVRQERLDRGEDAESGRFAKYFGDFAKVCGDHWIRLGGKLPVEYY